MIAGGSPLAAGSQPLSSVIGAICGASQRVGIAAQNRGPLSELQDEHPLISGDPVSRDARGEQTREPYVRDADAGLRGAATIGNQNLHVTADVPHATEEANDRGWTPDLCSSIPPIDRDVTERALGRAGEQRLVEFLARTGGEKRPACGKCVCGHGVWVLRCGEERLLIRRCAVTLACSMPRISRKRGTAGDISGDRSPAPTLPEPGAGGVAGLRTSAEVGVTHRLACSAFASLSLAARFA